MIRTRDVDFFSCSPHALNRDKPKHFIHCVIFCAPHTLPTLKSLFHAGWAARHTLFRYALQTYRGEFFSFVLHHSAISADRNWKYEQWAYRLLKKCIFFLGVTRSTTKYDFIYRQCYWHVAWATQSVGVGERWNSIKWNEVEKCLKDGWHLKAISHFRWCCEW